MRWGNIVIVAALGMACQGSAIHYRSLHEVDGQVVYSKPVSPVSYQAYLQGRLAMEADPPDYDRAAEYLERALRLDPRDPHLWTSQAELEHAHGADEQARHALKRALELRPDYPPAIALDRELRDIP